MKKLSVLMLLVIILVASIAIFSATAAAPASPDDSYGLVLNLKIDSREMTITGTAHTLNDAPFVQNGIPFVPLREIFELCDGHVRYNSEDKSVLVSLPKKGDSDPTFSQLWIGMKRVLGNASEEVPHRESFYNLSSAELNAVTEALIPVLKNGRLYIPIHYLTRLGFPRVEYDLQSGNIRIDDFYDGRSLAGFTLDSDFSLYDKTMQAEFKTTGNVELIDDGALKQEIFTNEDVEICIRTGEPRYIKNEGVRQEIHSITLVSDNYSTPRGVRVGDSRARFLELYGDPGQYIDRMKVEFQNDVITCIGIFSMD